MPRFALLVALVALSGSLAPVLAADPPEEGMVSLFDGKSLKGWERRGGTAEYTIEDGVIVGTTKTGSPNTFLCTEKEYGDFVLSLEVKCDPALNSGIQIRSHAYEEDTVSAADKAAGRNRVREAGEIYGYQCEIVKHDDGLAGNFWDEARHQKWHDDFSDKPEARDAFKDNEWNTYRIEAKGNHIRSWINGVPCADFTDDEDKSGLIGLQVHSIPRTAGPYQVRWRNIYIRDLDAK